MLEDLLLYYDHPVWPIFLVVISTFVLEDIAIIGAGFLAASEKMAPGLAFFAVCLGIFIGDTALYLLGRLALVWPWLRHKMRQPLIRRQMRPLQLSPWSQIMLIRCMPGIRTFGYIACGLARVHPVPFCLANVVSIVGWAAALFFTTLYLGRQFGEELHGYMWYLLPLALVLFWLGQRRIKRKIEAQA
ncbi:MAG: VTT domain-containing protein [Alcanivorax sp.]|jgi:membrane protein DedA with SNARE-associated domain